MIVVLTGSPPHHRGSVAFGELRLNFSVISMSYMLLSTIPCDSGYRPWRKNTSRIIFGKMSFNIYFEQIWDVSLPISIITFWDCIRCLQWQWSNDWGMSWSGTLISCMEHEHHTDSAVGCLEWNYGWGNLLGSHPGRLAQEADICTQNRMSLQPFTILFLRSLFEIQVFYGSTITYIIKYNTTTVNQLFFTTTYFRNSLKINWMTNVHDKVVSKPVLLLHVQPNKKEAGSQPETFVTTRLSQTSRKLSRE